MIDNNVNEKWISIDDAAEYLGVKPVTIRDWIRKGKDIPAHKIGKQWKFKCSELDAWISKIARNRERDEEVNKKLVFMGWTVIRFWGKDIRKNVDKCVNVIEETIFEIKLERDEEIDFNDNLDL